MITQISYLDEVSQPKAEALAKTLQLPCSSEQCSAAQLLVQNDQLSVSIPELGNPIQIDFSAGKYDHRRKFGGGKGQPLAKAIGLKSAQIPSVIDATAGFARDGFVIASLGCELRLLEQSPILAALIQDAILHAQSQPEIADIANRMYCNNCNSINYLQQLAETEYPDVIYMDPMYPSREKSALVKKEMQLLHQLIGPDTDSAELLSIAKTKAKKRVVVKRPKGAEHVGEQKPSVSIESKNTRYDVYVTL